MISGSDWTKLLTVTPQLRQAVAGLIREAAEYGADVAVIEGKRAASRQQELYRIGRRGIPGERPVTWTLDSKHITGDAVDLGFRVGGRVSYAVPAWWWDALGYLAEGYALWRPAVARGDLGHYELRRRR